MEPYGPVQACNGIALPLPLCASYQDLIISGAHSANLNHCGAGVSQISTRNSQSQTHLSESCFDT
jgi:hypothetical protein